MRFQVIDTKTGEKPDLKEIALHEEWAKGLMWCDMEGFAIQDDGLLLLLDECGRYAYCPEGRFRVESDFFALLDATRKFLEVKAKFQYTMSPDMGNKHGLSIRVPQGGRGEEYHDAEAALVKALDGFKDPDPHPITEEMLKRVQEHGKGLPDPVVDEDDDL